MPNIKEDIFSGAKNLVQGAGALVSSFLKNPQNAKEINLNPDNGIYLIYQFIGNTKVFQYLIQFKNGNIIKLVPSNIEILSGTTLSWTDKWLEKNINTNTDFIKELGITDQDEINLISAHMNEISGKGLEGTGQVKFEILSSMAKTKLMPYIAKYLSSNPAINDKFKSPEITKNNKNLISKLYFPSSILNSTINLIIDTSKKEEIARTIYTNPSQMTNFQSTINNYTALESTINSMETLTSKKIVDESIASYYNTFENKCKSVRDIIKNTDESNHDDIIFKTKEEADKAYLFFMSENKYYENVKKNPNKLEPKESDISSEIFKILNEANALPSSFFKTGINDMLEASKLSAKFYTELKTKTESDKKLFNSLIPNIGISVTVPKEGSKSPRQADIVAIALNTNDKILASKTTSNLEAKGDFYLIPVDTEGNYMFIQKDGNKAMFIVFKDEKSMQDAVQGKTNDGLQRWTKEAQPEIIKKIKNLQEKIKTNTANKLEDNQKKFEILKDLLLKVFRNTTDLGNNIILKKFYDMLNKGVQ